MTKKTQCKAGNIIPSLTRDQYSTLVTTIAAKGYIAAAMAMQADGIDLAEQNIRRHHGAKCSCNDYRFKADVEQALINHGLTQEQGETKPRRERLPKEAVAAATTTTSGETFGYEYDGQSYSIQTSGSMTADGLISNGIAKAGLNPAEWVVTPTNISAWEVQTKNGPQLNTSVKFRLDPVQPGQSKADFDALMTEARKAWRSAPKATPTVSAPDEFFVVATGDWQLAKVDGDGLAGTIARIYEMLDVAVARYQSIPAKQRPRNIALLLLGDLVEGFASQGGGNTWRTVTSTTDQLMTLTRVLMDFIIRLAALCEELVVASVPGNHDDTPESRQMKKNNNDSFVSMVVGQVETITKATGTLGNVRFIAPARDGFHMVIDLAGTRVGMTHGHVGFAKATPLWWGFYKNRLAGRDEWLDVDLIIAGHKHHFELDARAHVTFIQTPALESVSEWWRQATGEDGRPGFLTLIIGGGSYRSLELHDLTNYNSRAVA